MKSISSILTEAAPNSEYSVKLHGSKIMHPNEMLGFYRLVGQYGGRNVNNVEDTSGDPTYVFPTVQLAQGFEEEVKIYWPSIRTETSWRTTHTG